MNRSFLWTNKFQIPRSDEDSISFFNINGWSIYPRSHIEVTVWEPQTANLKWLHGKPFQIVISLIEN
jgi:hypothetical protein